MSTTAVKKKRPKYLNLQALLFEIRLPLPGWVSILHRISDAYLFLGMVWVLHLLDRSLASPQSFDAVRHYLGLAPVKLGLLVLFWALCHHLCAGIRFLLLDLDWGVDKPKARLSSWVVIGVSLGITAALGVKLW